MILKRTKASCDQDRTETTGAPVALPGHSRASCQGRRDSRL